ncbi:hypothetical protein M9H77_24386 [Catharanthus roseus]|uniref:Uncharacterized protein n=1 Tax=Catharanthus roseus TaxID=4058 RepID=A0ACC0AZZ6_CATRO|nr:hypothetical protein M9H77_24386 [Catharanthus roseus]
MAAKGKFSAVMMVMMGILVITAQVSEAAMSCSTVINGIYPCYNYVMNGGDVPAACCNGIKSLNNAAKTRSDRQSVCSCLKSMAKGISMNFDNIASLPTKCGVNVPYKISPDMDCAK